MILETFDIAEWNGPFEAGTRARAQRALEHGRLLYFPGLPFRLSNSENEFLDAALTDGKAKNISLDHTRGKLQGTSAEGEKAGRLAGMIERFGAGAASFVKDLLPNYGGVERARTSFRPVEVEDRPYSVIQDDRLLHVDAFPSRPMKNGRRILRFFSTGAAGRQRAPLAGGRGFRGFRRQIRPPGPAASPRQELAVREAGRDAGTPLCL